MSVAKDQSYVIVTNNNSQDICNKNGTEEGVADDIGMGNQTEHNDYNDQVIETESNCSMEDTVAKLEHALRKNFKAQSGEDDGEEHPIEVVEEDPTQLKGYQSIPDNLPEWKKAMIKKKNDALIEEHIKTLAEMKAEQDKWEGIPEWKKKLIMEKERKKSDDTTPEAQEAARRQAEEERLAKLPTWKRDLLLKKKGEL